MKKPPSLVYGADEIPPAGIVIVSAIQHVAVVAMFMIYPLIVARHAGAPAIEIEAIMRMSVLALAIAVLLQALPRGPVGSRFLAPSIFTGIYIAPSLLAADLGGLPLVWGMTIFAGLVEIGLSRIWSRLRVFIPPETAGMVVFLVGVTIGLVSVHVITDDGAGGMISGRDALIGGVSLGTMIGLNIWNKGSLRLFCILAGMVVGYGLAGLTGALTAADMNTVLDKPLLALPSVSHLAWAFDWSMVIPFAVSALAGAMSSAAVVTTYQRLTDADWVSPEARSISSGLLGDGIAVAVAGLFGTHGLTVSTANVGLVAATGVASRRIAFVVAPILVLAAFEPRLIGMLIIMPPSVMAAALLFTAVFIMISGIQIISTRVLDSRRTLVIGSGMMAFFVVSMFPKAFMGVPGWAQPLVTSPLVLATLVALSLNLLFRIGIRRTVAMTVEPSSPDLQEVANFVARAGGAWGARRDVIGRVEFAVQQAVEVIAEYCRVRGPIELSLSYDEFNIDARLAYEGIAMELPEWAPSQEDFLETEEGPRRLAGFMVRRQSDRATSTVEQRTTFLRLNFKH